MWVVSQSGKTVVNLDRVNSMCITSVTMDAYDGKIVYEVQAVTDGTRVSLAGFDTEQAAAAFLEHMYATIGFERVKYVKHIINHPGYVPGIER